MVSMSIKISVQKVSTDSVSLVLNLKGQKRLYEASIVNDRGVFGVELPSDLCLLLQQFPAESKELIGQIRNRVTREARLQAA
jgi:hypothetical protein